MSKEAPLGDEPFSYRESKDDRVQIMFRSKTATTLKGKQALRFLARIERLDAQGQQLLMARETGQFKFGNERGTKPRS
ncbi:MAG: hypothetical protein NXH85_15960 [Pseudomonadaceae bacterium]|nr:hypothetical protein [Pseudomonadaceae bacterium]